MSFFNGNFRKKYNADNVNMNWDFLGPSDVENLESENIIEEYENKVGYTFPEDFKSFMRQCNGAFLEKELFHFKPNARWAEAYELLAKLLYPELKLGE